MGAIKKIFLLTATALFINNINIQLKYENKKTELFNNLEEKDYFEIYAADKYAQIIPANSLKRDLNISDLVLKLIPGETAYIDNPEIDLTPTITKTIYGKTLRLEKQVLLHNPSEQNEYVLIKKDQDGQLVFHINNSAVFNGPFVAYKENNKIRVSCAYELGDVVPLKVKLMDKNEESIIFVSKNNQPAYFISENMKYKKLNGEDIIEMLKSYDNAYGDYFNTSPKTMVCTDQLTLPFLTSGIDLEQIIEKHKISGNEYKHRNINVILKLLDIYNVKNKYIHYFHNGDKKKIYAAEGYSALNPESFGINSFKAGQGIIFTRYYNDGPLKGQEQRTNVHVGVISEVNDGKIIKVSMVTSRAEKPPYDKKIMSTTDVDFYHWYENLRREYVGSDETPHTLTYRVLAIIDLPEIINHFKNVL
ncbi:MAG: hypothetical protein QXK76_01625 [Candidatus Woesearchaeota archaeon]